MALLIPIQRTIDDASHFTQQATLDGVNYTIDFVWNERDNFWYTTILTEDGQSVCTPQQRLLCSYLGAKYLSNRVPAGFLLAVDGNAPFGQGVPPGYDDLGSRVQIFYVSPSEL